MIKNLQNKPAYPWILMSISFVFTIAMLGGWLAPAALMPMLMEDLGISISLAGYTLTIITVVGGVMMFAGSAIVNKFGIKRTKDIGMWLLSLGCLIASFAHSYVLLIAGRFLFAIGYGINGATGVGLIMMWFDRKQRVTLLTIQGLVSALSMAIGLGASVPLYNMLGSWQSVMAAFAGLGFICAILWSILASDKEASAQVTGEILSVDSQNPIRMALKSRPVIFLTILMAGEIITYNVFNTYFPTFFQTFRGMSAATAGTLTALLPFIGMAGSSVGGFLTGKTGKRKPVMALACIGVFVGGVGALLIPSGVGLILSMSLIGLFNMLLVPPSQSIGMDIPGSTPAFAGAAMSMAYGVPQILTIFVPMIFGPLSESFGMQTAFLIFCVPLALSIIVAVFLMPETGPGKDNADVAKNDRV